MCCTRLAGNAGRKKSPKSRHLRTIVQLCRAISSQLRHFWTIGKNLLSSNICSRCPDNMVNFGLPAAEIDPVVCGTPANFNGFLVLAALLHGSQVVSVSQTLRRLTEGATCVRQGDHHDAHWPTFLVIIWFHFYSRTYSVSNVEQFLAWNSGIITSVYARPARRAFRILRLTCSS